MQTEDKRIPPSSVSTVEKDAQEHLNRKLAYNEYCQLECERNMGENPKGTIRRLDCVMTIVQRDALLAEIRWSLSEGRGPFHRHDERFGNATMHVPRAEPE